MARTRKPLDLAHLAFVLTHFRTVRVTDRAHLAFVRERGCVVRATPADRCFGRIEPHHVRTAANAGMGMLPPDTATVGLCCRHHRALHRTGRRTFETLHGVDLAAEARRLAAEDAPEQEPIMLDTHDPTLDLLRQREGELVLAGRLNAEHLAGLREIIARATSGRVRTPPRQLRTPAERIADAHAADTVDAALESLGRRVAAREAELEAAALSDAHLRGVA